MDAATRLIEPPPVGAYVTNEQQLWRVVEYQSDGQMVLEDARTGDWLLTTPNALEFLRPVDPTEGDPVVR